MKIAISTSFVYLVCLLREIVEPAGLSDQCFCKLKGKVEQCCCDVETVDKINNKIHPILDELVKRNYFKFFRVKLDRPCPFWTNNDVCAIRHCSVLPCKEEEVPVGIKAEGKYGETCQESSNTTLGNLDDTISAKDKLAFDTWRQHDNVEENFCALDDESTTGLQYIDLLRNPEQYTGYKGFSAHRIWNSIYQENCFKPKIPYSKGYNYLLSKNIGDLCLEKRVFYRAISGLHASINIHLSARYLFSETAFQKPKWGMNLKEFRSRFDSDATAGQGPEWLKNLYFTYTLVLRAITKAAPYWETMEFYTGEYEEDEYVRKLVFDLLAESKACPSTFDETVLFKDPATATVLKEEFRSHFHNVSRIMDCVGCEKCKVWGKLQVQGLGTALKILFSGHEFENMNFGGKAFYLTRSEIVSLFNGFTRLSSSIHYLHKFKAMEHEHR
ncbi:ERO1-like protein beta isoform X2 [Nematostella vectensis]|uniref:ERO1-like protein beta isoform X2 n=1 Tax=Nematostella vectensis TaxID=45351 RepID=UPI0013904FF4|nr:ERO1-like protein beta isoform X2 [Nematostella vectensis]